MKKYTDTGKKDTRSGFGDGLTELGKKNKADLMTKYLARDKIDKPDPNNSQIKIKIENNKTQQMISIPSKYNKQ